MTSVFPQYRRTPSMSGTSICSEISSKANGIEEAFIDVYRESQLNGLRRIRRRKATGQFVQEDEDGDSGFIDRSYASNKSISIPTLEKTQLDRRGMDLCRELRTVTKLTDDFRRDVAEERMSCSDLLIELGSKIRPYLVRLDEEMATHEEMVKKNLDRCLITDQKVEWLLRHNQFLLEFRQLVERLTTNVYDELERLLRLKVRGAHGAAPKVNLRERLAEIVKALDQIENEVTKENADSISDSLKSTSICSTKTDDH